MPLPQSPIRFRYLHDSSLSRHGVQCGKVLWGVAGRWPMTNGQFPAEHPVHADTAQLEMFTWRGYEVTPFPEGDGFIVVLKHNQTADQVVHDIEECFEWRHAPENSHGTVMKQ